MGRAGADFSLGSEGVWIDLSLCSGGDKAEGGGMIKFRIVLLNFVKRSA